jgi:hypothetical protein
VRFFNGVDLGYENPSLNERLNFEEESEISQRDISPLVWGCLFYMKENNSHNTRKVK